MKIQKKKKPKREFSMHKPCEITKTTLTLHTKEQMI